MGFLHLLAEEKCDLLSFVGKSLVISENESRSLIKLGAVYVNKARQTNEFHFLNLQDYVRLHSKPKRYSFAQLKLIQQCDEFLVLEKPKAAPSHPTVDNELENILVRAQSDFKQKLFLTHRLDIPTSGVFVLAKTTLAQKKFNFALMNQNVLKFYSARVNGIYQGPQVLKHWMKPDPRAPKILSDVPVPNWQFCQTSVLAKQDSENFSQLTLQLHTGRTHQIRAQLAKVGFPIIGDSTYATEGTAHHYPNEIELHCTHIEFSSENRHYIWRSQPEFDLTTKSAMV